MLVLMKLDVYRSCSWSEKREVLEAFWRSSSHASAKIDEAALQYGPLAILSLGVVVVELALIVGVTLGRGYAWGWLGVAFEAVVIASLWWSILRLRVLRDDSSVSTATED
jgi:hypothetical protein